MGTNIRFSTAFHPQTSGQVKRVNQILEDMLRACVISFGMKWEDCLPYAEFSYNNSFQASSGKAPFEILYGRKCRTPLNWSETGERQLLGNDLITEAEEMCKVIRDNLKAAQSRQKSYYDSKHRDLAFEIRDHVYLRVSPMKGTRRFGIKGKLAPRYVGPFKIVSKRGDLAYQLGFLQTLQMFMTCSIYLSSESASRLLTAPSTLRTLSSKKISLIVSTQLLFLKRLNARLATSQSNSSKLSGLTIPTVKLPGNARITSVLSTRSSFSPRSRDEIFS